MWGRVPTLVVSVVSAWAENRIDTVAGAAAAFFNSNEKSHILAVSFAVVFFLLVKLK